MQTFSIDESAIGVRCGERFCFVAPAVPTAGYRWSVRCDGPAVVEVESMFENTSGAIGGGAVQRIVLESNAVGVVTIRLSYAQEWVTTPEDEREIEVSVTG